MYLLDTNVVSELRKPRPHGAVVAWVDRTPDEDLYLSAVTLGELQAGVEITREQDPSKAAEIEAWIDLVAQTWNVLPVDARVFRSWATLMHRRPDHLIEDALIAAFGGREAMNENAGWSPRTLDLQPVTPEVAGRARSVLQE